MSDQAESEGWTTVVSKNHQKDKRLMPRDTAPSGAASSNVSNNPTVRHPRTLSQPVVSRHRDQNISESANSGASSTTSPLSLADDKAEVEATSPVVQRWGPNSVRGLPGSAVEKPPSPVGTRTEGPSSRLSVGTPHEPMSSTSHNLASSSGRASAGSSNTHGSRPMRWQWKPRREEQKACKDWPWQLSRPLPDCPHVYKYRPEESDRVCGFQAHDHPVGEYSVQGYIAGKADVQGARAILGARVLLKSECVQECLRSEWDYQSRSACCLPPLTPQDLDGPLHSPSSI